MKTWKNCGQTMVAFNNDEQSILRERLNHLIEGRWFKENSEGEIEKIIFELFPDLNNNLYLAKAMDLNSQFSFHPIVGKKVSGTTKLYHLTKNVDAVRVEGLKGFSYSNDGVRFYSNRIYFSVKSFVDIKYLDDSVYMQGRDELCVEVTEDMEIFCDPEYNEQSGMVFVNVDEISLDKITFTGFRFE